MAWTEYSSTVDTKSIYLRRRATVWEPKQLISGESLGAFLLDEDMFPWALVGSAVVRPQ